MKITLEHKKKLRLNKLLILDFVVLLLFIPFYFGVSHIVLAYDLIPNKGGTKISEGYLTPINSLTNIQASTITGPEFVTLGAVGIRQSSGVVTLDPRVLAMQRFLLDNGSPMAPYANTFIEEADKYGLDWRLVASISAIESVYGNLIPVDSYNAWGWRGGPGGSFSKFKDWNEGIATVTKGLALGYGTDLTPYEIEPAYCPPCYQNPAHSWAGTVTKNMGELSVYLDNL